MSKIHFEEMKSKQRLTIKSGSFIATTKVDGFKQYELSNLIGEFYLQDELPEEQQSPAYKAWIYNAASLSIIRDDNETLVITIASVEEQWLLIPNSYTQYSDIG